MKLRRLDVEGFRSIDALSWKPGDLTLLTGARADDLRAAALHVANTTRGWSAFGEGFAEEPPHPTARFTDGFAESRWFAHLAPAEGESLAFGYELLVERVEQNNGWAIVYERFTLDDEFDVHDLLERQGSRAAYTPAPKSSARAGAPKPKEQRATLADDMPALGAIPAFYNEPRVRPYAERIDGWCRYGRFDLAAPRGFTAERAFHDRMASDGRNLVNALYSLWDFEPRKAPILAGLKRLDPTVQDVVFPKLDETTITAALAHEGGRTTGLAEMSDATLEWLLRGAMLSAVSPAPLMFLDAADEGLPVEMIAPLAALLRECAGRVQVVLVNASEGLSAAVAEAFAGDGPTLVRTEV